MTDAEFRRRAHALLSRAIVMERGASHDASEDQRELLAAGAESDDDLDDDFDAPSPEVLGPPECRCVTTETHRPDGTGEFTWNSDGCPAHGVVIFGKDTLGLVLRGDFGRASQPPP